MSNISSKVSDNPTVSGWIGSREPLAVIRREMVLKTTQILWHRSMFHDFIHMHRGIFRHEWLYKNIHIYIFIYCLYILVNMWRYSTFTTINRICAWGCDQLSCRQDLVQKRRSQLSARHHPHRLDYILINRLLSDRKSVSSRCSIQRITSADDQHIVAISSELSNCWIGLINMEVAG